MSQQLTIFGAAYGPADVTTKVWSLVKNHSLNVTANNETFGDSWPSVTKSLVIVYQYTGQNDAQVAIAAENKTIQLSPPGGYKSSDNRSLFQEEKLTKIAQTVSRRMNASSQQLEILGAAYGLLNVTTEARSKIVGGTKFDQLANNNTWGDGWHGVVKTLVVVYRYDKIPMLAVVKENERMYFLVSPPLYVLGAAYGPSSVTEKVQLLVTNRALNFTANNETFGDTWPGVIKSMVLVYQYGNETPKTIFVSENSPVSFSYEPSDPYVDLADPTKLTFIGAVYGLGDVTGKSQSLVVDNSLNVTANNATFGDTWHDVVKTYVAVYLYGMNRPMMRIIKENETVDITKTPTPTFPGLIDASNLFGNDDVIALNASNDKYVTCDANSMLVASADSISSSCQLVVERPAPSKQTISIKGQNGKYVIVGKDMKLYVTADRSQATLFTVSYSMFGGIRLAANNLYVHLNLSDQSLQADATDNFSEGTAFEIAINKQSEFLSSRKLEELSDCEVAELSFVWQLTGGFFLALGLGPYFSTGTPNPGLLALIESNPTARDAVQALLTALRSADNAVATIPAAVSTIAILYKEGLLWTIMKFFLKIGIWTLTTKVLAKVIQVIFLPEAAVALLLASFTTWSIQLVQGGFNVASACN